MELGEVLAVIALVLVASGALGVLAEAVRALNDGWGDDDFYF